MATLAPEGRRRVAPSNPGTPANLNARDDTRHGLEIDGIVRMKS
jgi:hypothetical protein